AFTEENRVIKVKNQSTAMACKAHFRPSPPRPRKTLDHYRPLEPPNCRRGGSPQTGNGAVGASRDARRYAVVKRTVTVNDSGLPASQAKPRLNRVHTEAGGGDERSTANERRAHGHVAGLCGFTNDFTRRTLPLGPSGRRSTYSTVNEIG